MTSRLLLFALLLVATISRRAAADDFADGTVAARAGDFSKAALAFKKSIQAQPSSGGLVNLGIAEWQSGHAGVALLAWEQAAWLNPQDAAARKNLKFARQVMQVDAPELHWFETLSTWLPPITWAWLAGAGLWLAGGALVLPRVFRRKKSDGLQALAALGVCIFIFALTANVGLVSRRDIGFVVKKNAALRLTPTSGSELHSTLPAGEPLRRVKTRGNYFFVRTPMASGWIARDQVGFINE